MEKFLIAGLGNIGSKYENTHHNAGFMVLDEFARLNVVPFEDKRYGSIAKTSLKGRQIFLLKPSTFMNLSGMAVRYWMNKENIPIEHLLVIVDDFALPFGSLRLRGKGSAGGHNGLKNIAENLGSEQYARLRFGTGHDFTKGRQIDFVLSKFDDESMQKMPELEYTCGEIIKSFCLSGLAVTMNQFNHKKL